MSFDWRLRIGFAVKPDIATHYVRYRDPNHHLTYFAKYLI